MWNSAEKGQILKKLSREGPPGTRTLYSSLVMRSSQNKTNGIDLLETTTASELVHILEQMLWTSLSTVQVIYSCFCKKHFRFFFSWSVTNVKMNIEFFSLDLDKCEPRTQFLRGIPIFFYCKAKMNHLYNCCCLFGKLTKNIINYDGCCTKNRKQVLLIQVGQG